MLDRRRMQVGSDAAVALAGDRAAWRGMGSMAGQDRAAAATRAPLPPSPPMRDLIRDATLAPSGPNAQPWRSQSTGDGIAIRTDHARRTPVVDPDDHHLFASLGGAAESLAIAASAQGPAGELAFEPASGGPASGRPASGRAVRFVPVSGTVGGEPAWLAAIPMRRTTRGDHDGTPVGPADLASLRPDLAARVGLPGRRPDLVVPFGRGRPAPVSARRPVAEVILA